MRSILFLVCGNGKGHSERCRYILNALASVNPEARLTWIGPRAHLDFNKFKHLKFEEKKLEPARTKLELEALVQFIANILRRDLVDTVISDNLAEPALLDVDLMLIANHLWHEERTHYNICPEVTAILRKSLRDRRVIFSALFEKHYHHRHVTLKTPLYGPRLRLIEERDTRIRGRPKVLICAGTGGFKQRSTISRLSKKLIRAASNFDFFGDTYLYPELIKPFPFTRSAFGEIDAIFTRASGGMVSDSLRWGIKPVLFPPDDSEMEQNAVNLLRLGLGFCFEDAINNPDKVLNNYTDYNDFGAEIQIAACLRDSFKLNLVKR